MDYRQLYAKTQELAATAQVIGALGAELRLRQTGREGDPRVRGALRAIVTELAGPGAIDGLEPGQMATIVGQLTYALQEALDLMRDPERAPGWTYIDPVILQERGRGSRAGATNFRNMAETRPALRAILEDDCRFLDVGIGAAWLSIQAAQYWPRMRIVGLDILEPALTLAEANIAEHGLHERIALRRQSITELDDEAAYNLAWLPSMFLPVEAVDEALPRVARALVPGGMLVLGMFAAAPGPHGATVRDLLTIRSGGHPWGIPEIEARLTGAGFRDLEFVNAGSTTCVMLATR